MNENKKFSLTTCVVALLIIAMIALCVVYVIKSKESKAPVESNTTNVSQEVETIPLNLYDTITVLLSKIPLKYNNIGVCDEGKISNEWKESFYKDEKVTFNDLSDEEKIITVLNNANEKDIEITDLKAVGVKRFKAFADSSEEEIYSQYYGYGDESMTEVKVYRKDVIEYTAKRVFGEDGKNINWKSIYSGVGYNVEYIDGKYYWYQYFGGGLGNCTYGESKLIKAEQSGDYIYLYDKFIYTSDYDSAVNNGNLHYYTSSTMAKEIETIEPSMNIDMDKICETLLESKSEKLNTYKHTFKKDSNGNYYWISTEIAK